MIKYNASVIINRPVEDVFSYVANVQNYDKWTDMQNNRLISDGPFSAGSKIATTLHFGPFKVDLDFNISEFEPNRTLSFRSSTTGPLEWDSDFTFEAQETPSTQVRNVGELRLKGLWKLAEPLMAPEVRKGEMKELEQLKLLLESNS